MTADATPLPGLRLRPIAADDVDALLELDSDPEVMRYITGGQTTSRATCEEHLIPRILSHHKPERGRGYFAIVDEGDDFLGWAHLRPDYLEPAWLEIGYRLHRRWWGRGIATWAAAQLLARGLADPEVGVISARANVANIASQRVMEKIGMRRAGEFTFPRMEIGDLVVPEAQAVLYLFERA